MDQKAVEIESLTNFLNVDLVLLWIEKVGVID
jgi:hypothetical protein